MVGAKRRRPAPKNANPLEEDNVADSSDHEVEGDIDDGGREAVRFMTQTFWFSTLNCTFLFSHQSELAQRRNL